MGYGTGVLTADRNSASERTTALNIGSPAPILKIGSETECTNLRQTKVSGNP